GRVVGQVAGESLVQGLIGGAAGLVIGFAGIVAINLIAPTISTAPADPFSQRGGEGGPMVSGPAGGAFAPGGMQSGADIVLQAPVTLWVVVAAVGIAVL